MLYVATTSHHHDTFLKHHQTHIVRGLSNFQIQRGCLNNFRIACLHYISDDTEMITDKISINQIWSFISSSHFLFVDDFIPVKKLSAKEWFLFIFLPELTIPYTYFICVLIILQCIKQRLKRSSSSLFTSLIKSTTSTHNKWECNNAKLIESQREGIIQAYWITFKRDYHACCTFFVY